MGIVAFVLAHWGLLYLPLYVAIPPPLLWNCWIIFSQFIINQSEEGVKPKVGVTSGHIVYAKQKDIYVKVRNIYLSALPVKALCFNQCIDTFLIYQHSIIDKQMYYN